MVRALLVLLAVLAVSGEAVCAESRPVRAGNELDFLPYSFTDANGRSTGFGVELLRAVADTMGLPLELAPGPWDSVWSDLVAGKLDVLPAVARTPRREGLVDFGVPHTESFDAFFVRAGRPPIADIAGAAGKEIVVRRFDAAHSQLIERKFAGTIIPVDSIADGLRLIAAGRHDAFLCSKTVGVVQRERIGITGVIDGPAIPDYKRSFSFAVRKGNTELLEKLNEGLRILKATGEYDRLYQKWLGVEKPAPRWWETAFWRAVGILAVALSLGATWLAARKALETDYRHSRGLGPRRTGAWSWFWPYALAVVAVAASHAIRIGLESVVGPGLPPFMTFYPAILLPALLGGIGPGLMATLLAAGTAVIGLMAPIGQFAIQSPVDRVAVALFCCVGLFLTAFAELFRRNRAKAAAFDREEARRESEERFRLFMDNSPTNVWIKDEDGRYVYVSRGFEQRFGLQPADWHDKTDAQLWPPEDAAEFRGNDLAVLAADRPMQVTEELHSEDGSRCHWLSTKFPFRDAAGRRYVAGMALDITELKLTEEALQAARDELESRVAERTASLAQTTELAKAERQRLYDVLEALPAYVCLLTTDYRVAFSNRKFREWFGYHPIRKCYELLFDRSQPCENCESFKVLDGNGPHRWEWTGPNGRHYDIFDFPFVDTDGSPLILEMGIDITERKEAEQALKELNDTLEQRVEARTAARRAAEQALLESEQRYRTLFDSMTEGFALSEIITDEHDEPVDFRFLDVNPAFERLTGFGRSQVIGARVLEVMPRTERSLLRSYGHVALTGEPVHFDTKALGRWYEVFAYRPAPRQFAVIFTDVTERKAMSEALAEAKEAADRANSAKSVFLANMSHEMRTPLNAIVGLCHLLRRDLRDRALGARVEQLVAASDHLVGLISDILELSRIEADRLTIDAGDFCLRDVVTRVLEVLAWPARAKGLTLASDVPPALLGAGFRGDAQRLAQVLINLGSNAVKFTEQGSVRLSIEACGETAAATRLRFAVTDTGIGIAAEDQAGLFAPFSRVDSEATRAKEGSGLGLMISQKLVNAMGGHIDLASAPGAGSTFSFEIELPHADSAFAAAAQAPADGFRGRRVLFAEDDLLSQEIIFEMLADLGCDVEVASDGDEALACAQANDYDLILLDMRMPKMDGLAAARAIRALPRHRDTPIVAVSANAFVEDRRQCLDAGMNGHLAKPVTPERLATALARWLPGLAAAGRGADCDDALVRALRAVSCLDTASRRWRTPEEAADYAALLKRFVAQETAEVADLREAVDAGNGATAHDLAHKLKGIAGLVGARHVAAAADRIVAALRRGVPVAELAEDAAACAQGLAEIAAALDALPLAAAAA